MPPAGKPAGRRPATDRQQRPTDRPQLAAGKPAAAAGMAWRFTLAFYWRVIAERRRPLSHCHIVTQK
jgi:hypothetical protein